jgi:GNAT superfamily N-acetyltransferase
MFSMEALHLAAGQRFVSPELQSRIHGDFSLPNRAAYCIVDGTIEVAFAAFDLYMPGELRLYEVYVLPAHQGRGIGTWVLEHAYQMACRRGDKRILLRPRSLSNPPRDVVSFYLKKGYAWADDHPAGSVMSRAVGSPETAQGSASGIP